MIVPVLVVYPVKQAANLTLQNMTHNKYTTLLGNREQLYTGLPLRRIRLIMSSLECTVHLCSIHICSMLYGTNPDIGVAGSTVWGSQLVSLVNGDCQQTTAAHDRNVQLT